MRFIITTLIIIAAMSMMAAFALMAEGETLWSIAGAAIALVSFRSAGWFEYNYPNG
ncbi:hypothetical protein [Aeromonas phage 3]|nr:hypothetical protein [Aeromonas phage 3]